VRIAGFASAGGAELTGFDVVEARPQVVAGLAVGGTLLVVLVPMAQKEVPVVDQSFGRDLLVGVDGCGTTYFYAFPSKVVQFSEVAIR